MLRGYIPATRYHLTRKSGNEKTGPLPVSTTSADTCPLACPFIGAGCYAEAGKLGMHWGKVSQSVRGIAFSKFLTAVAAIPDGQLWRHNQAGDLPGKGNRIAAKALQTLARAVRHTKGFTYTHKPVEGTSLTARANRKAIRRANAAGFTVNLSANNAAHADSLADLKIGPVVAVLPSDAAPVTFTPAGRRIVTCPAQTRDNVTCASCGLCQRQERNGIIIGFLAHGASRRRAESAALAA